MIKELLLNIKEELLKIGFTVVATVSDMDILLNLDKVQKYILQASHFK